MMMVMMKKINML